MTVFYNLDGSPMDDTVKLAYDEELNRPGCWLLAAMMGADKYITQEFDTRDWLISPTPGLKVIEVLRDKIPEYVERTVKARPQPKAAKTKTPLRQPKIGALVP